MKSISVLLAAAVLSWGINAEAGYFDRIEVGARGLALAGTYGALAEDVSAVHWNPGGLSQLESMDVLLTHSRPYLLDDLSVSSLAVGLPVAGGGVAVSWNHLGVTDVVAEDLFSLAYGRWVYRDNSRQAHLGGTAKIARVSFDPEAGVRDFGSETAFTGDFGVYWQEGRLVRMGAVVRHLGEPDFDFVDAGQSGGTAMPGGLELSISYRWRPESVILMSRSDIGDHVAWNYAGEIWFYDVFAIRAGVFDEEFSGGFGLKGNRWEVDLAFLTQKSLGNTFRGSFLYHIPRGQEP